MSRKKRVSRLFKAFLESVSSTERGVYEKEPEKAVQPFRDFVAGLSDEEFMKHLG